MTKRLKNINQNLFLYPTLLSNNTTSKFTKNKLSLKKSFSFNNITNPNNSINNAKTIQIINSINITQYNNNYICNKQKIIDDETIKMKNRQINNEIKKINKILFSIINSYFFVFFIFFFKFLISVLSSLLSVINS